VFSRSLSKGNPNLSSASEHYRSSNTSCNMVYFEEDFNGPNFARLRSLMSRESTFPSEVSESKQMKSGTGCRRFLLRNKNVSWTTAFIDIIF